MLAKHQIWPSVHHLQLPQEVSDLQLAVQMRDDHLAECQRQSDIDQEQIDELERQLLMQVCQSTLKIFNAYTSTAEQPLVWPEVQQHCCLMA